MFDDDFWILGGHFEDYGEGVEKGVDKMVSFGTPESPDAYVGWQQQVDTNISHRCKLASQPARRFVFQKW